MGFGNNNGIAEGTHLSVRYPDDNSRNKSKDGWKYYWMRSPYVGISSIACSVWRVVNGYSNNDYAFRGDYGLVPLIVLS